MNPSLCFSTLPGAYEPPRRELTDREKKCTPLPSSVFFPPYGWRERVNPSLCFSTLWMEREYPCVVHSSSLSSRWGKLTQRRWHTGTLLHSFPTASHSRHSEEHCNTSACDHMNPLYTVYIQHSKHSIKTKIISSNPRPSSTPFSLTALLHPSPHFSLMLSPTQRSETMLSMFTTRTLHYCAQGF